MNNSRFAVWKQKAQGLKKELLAVYLACKDPRVPWYAKVLAILISGYALSPIDLIPDPIPILGYIDDLIIIPFGIFLVIKMIPPDVLDECRKTAAERFAEKKPVNWVAGVLIILIWLGCLVAILYLIMPFLWP